MAETPFLAATQFSVASVLNRSWQTMWKVPGISLGLTRTAAVLAAIPEFLLPGVPLALALGQVADAVMGLILSGAVAYAVFQELGGRHAGIGEALTRGLTRFFPLLLASLLTGMGMVLGFMLLLIPGLILMCLWSLVVPACVLERLGPLSSLSRSARLTKGYRWPVFGLILLTVIAGLILYAAAVFMATLLTDNFVAIIAFSIPPVAILTAFQEVMTTIIYYDLRGVKEGLTLDNLVDVFD